MKTDTKTSPYVTVNPCRLCAPLGASLAFKGVESALPLIHGSQGCATYIRRYIISHFREPVDIASSNFSEETVVFGGWENISNALTNLIRQYSPSIIGIATTCLTETIGDDINMWIRRYLTENKTEKLPFIIPVSTPSYKGSHEEGFHATVAAIVKACASEAESDTEMLMLPPMLTPEDLRYLAGICRSFGFKTQLLPDYNETLDGGTWDEYQPIPEGGTPLSSLGLKNTKAVIEFGAGKSFREAGEFLSSKFNSSVKRLNIPVGIKATDEYLKYLSDLSGQSIPQEYTKERNRLLDAYVDGHKYVFEKKAVVIGDEDTVGAAVSLLAEIGIKPVICATACNTSRLKEHIKNVMSEVDAESIQIIDEADYDTIELLALQLNVDICIGTSKGYQLSKKLGIPLVRIGFPIHDRFGASRLQMVGYKGTMQLFDRIVNALIEHRQNNNDIGYSYL
jgi:nitrogenase molybdenum-iron protein NifN